MQKLICSLILISFWILSNNSFSSQKRTLNNAHDSSQVRKNIQIDSLGKKLIVFSSDAASNDKQQIFIMDENGDNVRQLTSMDMNCISPRFSPDGRNIAFVATNPNSDYIYMVDLNDSSTFGFPKFITGGTDPVFSPDGKELLYRSEKNDNNAVYITELETDSSYIVSDGSLSTHAKFSPDGTQIIYTSTANGNMDLVILKLDDTTENAQKTVAASEDAELYGTFSPDGNLVAYASFDINYKGTVHVSKPDGTADIEISRGMASSYNPRFSPDGKYLAFVSGSADNLHIYLSNPDGSGVKQLTSGNTTVFDWSSDSKRIVYENKGESTSSINIIDIESGKSTNLTGQKANNINPSYQK